MTPATSAENHRMGLTAAFAGGLLLSIDVPILRMAATDAWTMIFIRGVFSFFALWLFWLVFRRGKGENTPFVNGYTSVLLACLTAVASILFLNAIQLTTVANVVFILAFNPMFAALLSWLVLGERTPLVTILAIVASFAGVLIIVWDSVVAGNPIGDLMAVGFSLLLACSLVIARRSGTDQSMSPAVGTLLAAVGVMWFAQPGTLQVESWGWLALNGLIVMPAASACMMLGPRYVSAPIVAMFFLLETVLTPVWMWLIFNEVPRTASLIGGVIIFVALLAHSVWKLQERAERPQRGSNKPQLVPKI